MDAQDQLFTAPRRDLREAEESLRGVRVRVVGVVKGLGRISA